MTKSKKAILAQPEGEYALFDYMHQKGYDYLEDERLGAMHVFEKDLEKAKVLVTINAYYQLWSWNE